MFFKYIISYIIIIQLFERNHVNNKINYAHIVLNLLK